MKRKSTPKGTGAKPMRSRDARAARARREANMEGAKSKTKPRTTLAKQISSWAGNEGYTSLRNARELARYGSIQTEVERHINSLLYAQTMIRKYPARAGSYSEFIIFRRAKLSEILVAAVLDRQPEVLRFVADVVENRSGADADKTRTTILSAKMYHEAHGTFCTISELAKTLNMPDRQDGFAALRRLAKELKFPIAPETRGRRKKIQTNKASARASKS
jgi:hypothetical protein